MDRDDMKEMVRQLRDDLVGRGIQVRAPQTTGTAPEGTRSAELVETLVTVAATAASVLQIIQSVQQWRAQHPRRKKIAVALADVGIPSAGAMPAELERIAGMVLERAGRTTSPTSGRRYALLVANAACRDPALRQLRSPVADVRALADVLKDPAIGHFEVELLIDATESTVRRRVAAFFANRDPHDLLLLHFSCHGLKDQHDRLYLAAEDTMLHALRATAVSAAYVADEMSETAAQRVLLVLDCCYSGAFARGAAVRSGQPVDVAAELGDGMGRVVLTASSATEYAFEGERLTFSQARPSVFTQALVTGLRTGAADLDNDGEVSVDELYKYAYQQMQQAHTGQQPRMWAFGMAGALVVAHSVGSPQPPDEIMDDLASPRVSLRLEAVEALATLLVRAGPRLREWARTELVRLRDHDDSVRVRTAAAATLSAVLPLAVPPRTRRRVLLRLAVAVCMMTVLMMVTAVHTLSSSPIETLVVGVDLAFQGASKYASDDTWDALRLQLEQQGSKAGRFRVDLRRYDNSTPERGSWDEAACTRNAHAHVAAASEVALLGPGTSGCAKLMAPVLNQAPGGPMLMVSQSTTYVGLTKAGEAGEPGRYFPNGERHYARMVPPDDVQGAAAAQFAAKDLKVRKVFVLDDTETYGKGVAGSFAQEIKKFGVEVVGRASWNRNDPSYTELFRNIQMTGADAVFLGGIFNNHGGQLVKDKVAVLGPNSDVRLIAPDGFTGRPDFFTMPESQGAYLVFPALSTEQLKAAGCGPARFLADFTRTYGAQPRSWHALYGVQALQSILAAIERSDGTRKGVRDAVFEGSGITIPANQAILGKTIRIDPASGDVNVKDVTLLQVMDHGERFVKQIST